MNVKIFTSKKLSGSSVIRVNKLKSSPFCHVLYVQVSPLHVAACAPYSWVFFLSFSNFETYNKYKKVSWLMRHDCIISSKGYVKKKNLYLLFSSINLLISFHLLSFFNFRNYLFFIFCLFPDLFLHFPSKQYMFIYSY